MAAAKAEQRLPGGVVTTMVDVRYLGQSHEITVPYRAEEGWYRLAVRFNAAHHERNGFHREDDPIEAVTVRAEAVGSAWFTFDDLPMWEPHGDAGAGTRTVLTGDGPVDASVYIRGGLEIGAEIVGPAIIEEREATIWIGARERAEVHRTGALEITW